MQQEDILKNQYNILKGRKEEPWNKMSMVSKRNIQGQQRQQKNLCNLKKLSTQIQNSMEGL